MLSKKYKHGDIVVLSESYSNEREFVSIVQLEKLVLNKDKESAKVLYGKK